MEIRCKYGCGQIAKTQLRDKSWICGYHPSQCVVNKSKNSQAIKKAHQEGRIPTGQLSDSRNWSKDKIFIPTNEIFCENSKYDSQYVKKVILKKGLIKYQCECGLVEWKNKPLVLELDHINGIKNDQRLENLRFLCPNCHSQTETFRGRNMHKQNGFSKASDKQIIDAIKKHKSVRQALLSLGLAGKGANYIRVNKILQKGEIWPAGEIRHTQGTSEN